MPRSSLQTAPPAGPDLFGNERARPPGLRYETDTFSAEEERALIERFASLPLAPFQFGAFEGKRRVASFGFRYDFSDQRLHEAAPFPEFIKPMLARVESFGQPCAGRHPPHPVHGIRDRRPASAGTATRPPSMSCSASRSDPPVPSAFAARKEAAGSATR